MAGIQADQKPRIRSDALRASQALLEKFGRLFLAVLFSFAQGGGERIPFMASIGENGGNPITALIGPRHALLLGLPVIQRGDINIQREVGMRTNRDGVEFGVLLQPGDAAVLDGGRPVRVRFAGRRLLEALPQRGARGDMAQIEGVLTEGILPKRCNMIIIAMALRQQPHIRRDDVAVGNVRVLSSRHDRRIQAIP